MRFKVFKVIVLVISIFVGVGAYVGGIAMLIEPKGSILPPYGSDAPIFPSFTIC